MFGAWEAIKSEAFKLIRAEQLPAMCVCVGCVCYLGSMWVFGM